MCPWQKWLQADPRPVGVVEWVSGVFFESE